MKTTNEKHNNTSQSADEKILNRIRKLLAMSKDTASPNEAAIAAKRARSLLDQYQLTELDIAAETKKGFEFRREEYKTNKPYNKVIGVMAVAIAKLNDCQARRVDDASGCLYTFEGMLVDSVTCVEMMMYLRGELYMQKLEINGRRNKNAYSSGFASGIASQVNEILKERNQQKVKSTGQSLVVVKTELVRQHYGTVKYVKKPDNNGYGKENAFGDGYTKGKNTSLSRQISDNYAAKITA